MKFFTTKTKKLPRAAQKSLLPRKEFIEHGRERFLAAFDASALARGATIATTTSAPAQPAYVATFFKIGIGALAALCVAVGVSAYADTANVPPTSPLYPLKRLSENVQLAVAPAPEKAQLQATFAVRRANEIAALQALAPSSTLIPKLTSDLDEDISSSLSASVGVGNGNSERDHGRGNSNGNGNSGGNNGAHATSSTSALITASSTFASSTEDAGPINVYCGAFNVSTSGVFIGRLESNLALHPGALAEFNEQCGSAKNNGAAHGHNENNESNATTTVTTSSTDGHSSHMHVDGLIPHIGD
jgi:hypothetical protein